MKQFAPLHEEHAMLRRNLGIRRAVQRDIGPIRRPSDPDAGLVAKGRDTVEASLPALVGSATEPEAPLPERARRNRAEC